MTGVTAETGAIEADRLVRDPQQGEGPASGAALSPVLPIRREGDKP